MSPAVLLVLVALGLWVVQTSAHRRRRNPYRPSRWRQAAAGQIALPTPAPRGWSGGWVWRCTECGRVASPVPNDRVCRFCGGTLRRSKANPRRVRPGAGQLALPESPAAYPVYHVAGGGKLPNRKKQPYWVFVQWAGVSSGDPRWFTNSEHGTFTNYADAAKVGRELARRAGGVFEDSKEARRRLLNRNPRRVPASAQPNPCELCRCGSGARCRNRNPYTQACAISGHVWDFRAGGRCECCGRMAPKRLVTLESDRGERSNYGRTCAGRAIGTTKLRTNQLEHIERQEREEERRRAVYSGVARGTMAESGIERPPYAWARGLSLSALAQIARDAGVSPYEYGWWDSANLVPGGKEMQYRQGVGVAVKRKRSGEYVGAVLEGGHRSDQRRSARTTTGEASRRRRAAPRFRRDVYVRAGEDLPW